MADQARLAKMTELRDRAVAEGHRIGAYWVGRIIELVDPLKHKVRAIYGALDEDEDTPVEDVVSRLRYMRRLLAKRRAQVALLQDANRKMARALESHKREIEQLSKK